MTLHQQLQQFYEDNGIPFDGGENDIFFDFNVLGVSFKLPNPEFRRKIIHIHDLEHVLYQCDTSWKGEAFIAGWEIATGMWKHLPVGLLSLWAMAYSLLGFPKSVFRGFKEGKQNIGIIDLNVTKEELLNMKKETLQKQIEKRHSSNFVVTEFTLWVVISQLFLIGPLLLIFLLYYLW